MLKLLANINYLKHDDFKNTCHRSQIDYLNSWREKKVHYLGETKRVLSICFRRRLDCHWSGLTLSFLSFIMDIFLFYTKITAFIEAQWYDDWFRAWYGKCCPLKQHKNHNKTLFYCTKSFFSLRSWGWKQRNLDRLTFPFRATEFIPQSFWTLK